MAEKKPLNWNMGVLIGVLAIALFQGIGYLIGLYVPSVAYFIKMSSALWFLILLALSVYIAYLLLQRNMYVDKKQVFILLIVLAVLIFFMYKLSPILPSIFDVKAVQSAYSFLG